MTAIQTNVIIDGYLKLLSGLSKGSKELLIKKLQSPKELATSKNAHEAAFGAWEGEESAEELIDNLRNARTENPIREAL
jgi:hypothetical protein